MPYAEGVCTLWAGRREEPSFYEAPFADIAPEGPEILFGEDELDRLFDAVETIRQNAEG
jgi:hypothetical protein